MTPVTPATSELQWDAVPLVLVVLALSRPEKSAQSLRSARSHLPGRPSLSRPSVFEPSEPSEPPDRTSRAVGPVRFPTRLPPYRTTWLPRNSQVSQESLLQRTCLRTRHPSAARRAASRLRRVGQVGRGRAARRTSGCSACSGGSAGSKAVGSRTGGPATVRAVLSQSGPGNPVEFQRVGVLPSAHPRADPRRSHGAIKTLGAFSLDDRIGRVGRFRLSDESERSDSSDGPTMTLTSDLRQSRSRVAE